MTTVDVQEAKTRLSELLKRVEGGEEVTITRSGESIAKLTATSKRPPTWGTLAHLGPIDATALLEPLSDDDLAAWEDGGAEDPLTR